MGERGGNANGRNALTDAVGFQAKPTTMAK
jgi:hypothetical protein